jgi:dihydroorotate dehydrogenase (NAD+) catalytic subunit
MDLSVEIAGIRLKNPVLLSSGTAGYGVELVSVTDLSSLGGVILKSVTLKPSPGSRAPRIWEVTGGMLNSIGLENIGADALVTDVLPELEGLDTVVIGSVAGDSVAEYAAVAEKLAGAPALRALEVNVSCPNVKKGGIQFGVDADATAEVVAAVCERTNLPVFAKLSAAVGDITEIALAAERAGASGLSLINTIPGLAIDASGRRPRLGAVTGGLSGPAIKPIALKAVWDCHRATGLPIIGGGGIYDAGDVVEFLVAGASCISVGTAIFQDPGRPAMIVDALPSAVALAGAGSPGELVGSLRM